MINLPLISIPMEMGGLLFLTDLDALILMYRFFNSAINGYFPLEIEIKIKMYLDIKQACQVQQQGGVGPTIGGDILFPPGLSLRTGAVKAGSGLPSQAHLRG